MRSDEPPESSNGEIPTVFTKIQAASYLQISVRTVDRLRERGELESNNVGNLVRITRSALQEYLTRDRSRKILRALDFLRNSLDRARHRSSALDSSRQG